MLKKTLDYFKGLKDDISEIDFYSVFKILFLIMLWIYPFPFMLLAKTSFKYTGYAYLLTIILISYFCFIKVNEDINSAFINLYKSAGKAIPYIIAYFILFWLGPAYWSLILLHENPLQREYRQSYVYAFPNKDYAKCYRVKADLDYDYDSDDRFQISKIYFSNGGYIEFNFCEDGNKKGDLFYCEASNDERDWYFRYYGEKVSNKEFNWDNYEVVEE